MAPAAPGASACRPVEVGHDGDGARRPQLGAARRLAGDGEHAKALRAPAAAGACRHRRSPRSAGAAYRRCFDFILSIHSEDCMTFQITVQPSGHQLRMRGDETVLAAAIRSGIGLPYGCKNGACGSCKGKVVEGTVHHKPHQPRALSEQEKLQGYALFCCAVPEGDVSIEAREVGGSSDYPVRKMPTRVTSITPRRARRRHPQPAAAGQRGAGLPRRPVRRIPAEATASAAPTASPTRPRGAARSNCTSATWPAACSPTTCSPP
jgi:ferredoxin